MTSKGQWPMDEYMVRWVRPDICPVCLEHRGPDRAPVSTPPPCRCVVDMEGKGGVAMDVEVWCPSCVVCHTVRVDPADLLPRGRRVTTECPVCGQLLVAKVELRAHVIDVRPEGKKLPVLVVLG